MTFWFIHDDLLLHFHHEKYAPADKSLFAFSRVDLFVLQVLHHKESNTSIDPSATSFQKISSSTARWMSSYFQPTFALFTQLPMYKFYWGNLSNNLCSSSEWIHSRTNTKMKSMQNSNRLIATLILYLTDY